MLTSTRHVDLWPIFPCQHPILETVCCHIPHATVSAARGLARHTLEAPVQMPLVSVQSPVVTQDSSDTCREQAEESWVPDTDGIVSESMIFFFSLIMLYTIHHVSHFHYEVIFPRWLGPVLPDFSKSSGYDRSDLTLSQRFSCWTISVSAANDSDTI